MAPRSVTLLGTGTSTGVPVIGCHCQVCSSDHPRNRRLRTSALVEGADTRLLIDSGPDFRQQALRQGLERLDGVLYTHAHADHIYGLDDLRMLNFLQDANIPCYGSEATLEALGRAFAYAFDGLPHEGGGKPRLDRIAVRQPFTVGELEIVPVPVAHGSLEVFGYRLGSFAYVTDCHRIPEESWALLAGVETLVLGALRFRPHPTHLSIQEAVEVARRLGAARVVFTHLTHEVDYTAPQEPLPAGMELGYDGMVLPLEA